ncbi:sulfotransferase [Thiorhodococcus minor]|uniref:Sulfotransferase n=1 Tax=Thiorhodococcus minor TaxID=57489 RepID=A0A6M0K832_9GAMM|nr:sulfotransferase [Thiorhodococcus minor]NEV64837.1 sulfotransferase [Thiorhodococcus minor]
MNALLKSSFLTALQGGNHLLRIFDRLFLLDDGESTCPPLFILGAPRSGSTLTYQAITEYFDVAYVTAPLGYAYGFANALTRILRPWLGRPKTVFSSDYGRIPGIFSPSEHANIWFQWFPRDGQLGHYLPPSNIDFAAYSDLERNVRSLSRIMRRPWVFKNLYLGMCAGALAQIFPDARFVIVRRDPLLIYQSVLRGRLLRPHLEWWSVKPPRYRDWLSLPLRTQVARQIFYAEAIPIRDLTRYAPGRYTEIEYSALCKEPINCMRALAKWLAPAGYRARSDSVMPNEFPASSNLTLDHAELEAVLAEFERLRQGFHAELF